MIRASSAALRSTSGGPRMRFVLAAAAALAATSAAFALPAGARVAAAGPQCGGTLWKLMTLSDTGKKSVQWTPSATSISDIAQMTAPAKITPSRSTSFQKHVWKLSTVIERYRVASNGELVLELFD